jgi:integrase
MPTQASKITREHVELFLVDLSERRSAATVATRYRGLQQLFKFLEDEGEITVSPMRKMRPPTVPDTPTPILGDAELKRLLKTVDGRTFEERRDCALIRLFLDTGMRRAEAGGLRVVDIDWDHEVAYVVEKGSRPRACPFGARTGQALDRYLRERQKHPYPEDEQAGLGPLHSHQLRHTFAHQWLSQGGGEGHLMRLAGWRSRQMLQPRGQRASE